MDSSRVVVGSSDLTTARWLTKPPSPKHQSTSPSVAPVNYVKRYLQPHSWTFSIRLLMLQKLHKHRHTIIPVPSSTRLLFAIKESDPHNNNIYILLGIQAAILAPYCLYSCVSASCILTYGFTDKIASLAPLDAILACEAREPL